MIKAILIFFGLFFALVGLLFWAKMTPATAQTVLAIYAEAWINAANTASAAPQAA
ncbi:MAG: hypothetical protein AAGA08_06895 [Pseudomonadota bacterium]